MRRRSSTIPGGPATARVAFRARLSDLIASICARRVPGMFANILVPLAWSALSERALPVAQHLAQASATTLHLLQVITLRLELDTLRDSGEATVEVMKMAQEAAQRL